MHVFRLVMMKCVAKMRKESFDVCSFARWLMKKRFFLRLSSGLKGRIQLKIVGVATTHGHPILQLQWAGQRSVFFRSLEEILAHEKLLYALDYIDLKKILQLKITTDLAPSLRLVAHFNENNTEKIVYKDKRNQTFIKNIAEIRKKDFIKSFSPNDAYLLGYLLAWEDQRQEILGLVTANTSEH